MREYPSIARGGVEGRAYVDRRHLARLRTPEVGDRRRICRTMGLHIDLIIQPEIETAHKNLHVLRAPGLSDIMDFAEGRVKLFRTVEELGRAGPPKNSLIGLIFRCQASMVGRRLQLAAHLVQQEPNHDQASGDTKQPGNTVFHFVLRFCDEALRANEQFHDQNQGSRANREIYCNRTKTGGCKTVCACIFYVVNATWLLPLLYRLPRGTTDARLKP